MAYDEDTRGAGTTTAPRPVSPLLPGASPTAFAPTPAGPPQTYTPGEPLAPPPPGGPLTPDSPDFYAGTDQRAADAHNRDVLDRMSIIANRHPWAPPDVAVAFANAPISKADMLGGLGQLQAEVAKLPSAVQSIFDDPVLSKDNSASMALKKYLTQALGPVPIAEADLRHIQTQLQSQGYAKALPVDGVWGQPWNEAYRNWLNDLKARQLGGDTGSGINVGTALHWLGSVLPSQAANAIIGFAKSLPSDAHHLVADVAGGVPAGLQAIGETVGLAGRGVYDAVTGGTMADFRGQVAQAGARIQHTAAAVSGAVEGHSADQQIAEVQADPGGRMLSDVATAFLLADAVGSVSRIGMATADALRFAGTDAAKDLGREAAARGPGVIVRTLGRAATDEAGNVVARNALPRMAFGAVAGGVPTYIATGDPLKAAEAGALGAVAAGAIGSPAFTNLPVIGDTGAWVAKIADSDGLYYRMRSLLASPYKLAGVRLAGDTVMQAGLYGAKVRGLAALSEAASSDPAGTALSRSVQGEKVVPQSVDNVIWFLHGSDPELLRKVVGSDVSAATDVLQNSLARSGIMSEVERGTGKSVHELSVMAGGPDRLANYVSTKVREFGARSYADHQWESLSSAEQRQIAPTYADKMKFLNAQSHAAWGNLDGLDAIVTEMVRSPGELRNRIARQITQTMASGDLRFEDALSQDLSKYLDVSDHVNKNILPHFDRIMEDTRQAFSGGLTDHVPGFEAPAIVTDGAPLGIARIDTLSAQQAHREANTIEKLWNEHQSAVRVDAKAARTATMAENLGTVAPVTADAELPSALSDRLDKYLAQNFGVDARGLKAVDSIDAKIGLLRQHASLLAADAMVTEKAPAELVAANNALHEMGYKLVTGTDIGWMHRQERPIDGILDAALTRRRKAFEWAVGTPSRVEDVNISAAREIDRRSKMQAVVSSEDFGQLPLHYNVGTVLADVRDPALIAGAKTGLPERVALDIVHATTNLYGADIEDLARELVANPDSGAKTLAQGRQKAWEQIRAHTSDTLNLRVLPRSVFMHILTRPVDMYGGTEADLAARAAEKAGVDASEIEPGSIPLFTKEQASKLWRAYIQGSSPSYMTGLSHIDQWVRAKAGLLGQVIPGEAGEVAGALPNNLLNLRDRMRFALNPLFEVRRVTKTNLKMAVEDVAPPLVRLEGHIFPTFSPRGALAEDGVLQEARDVLDRVMPTRFAPAIDDATQYLHTQGIFHLFSEKDYEAYAAWHLAQQGLDDSAIRAKLTRIFEYGSSAGQGRSGLERSTNFVFFPFSFEKTVIRNVGGYLLDHPAQMIMITRGLQAFDTFNAQHPGILDADAVKKHVPILGQALELNPFAHGLSGGEFGGINRPLLNLFIPQTWTATNAHVKVLERFIPAVKEIDDFRKSATAEAQMGMVVPDFLAKKFGNRPITASSPLPAVEPARFQLTDAFALRNQLTAEFATQLKYNSRLRGDATHLKFRGSGWGSYDGEDITAQHLNEIVRLAYPAYNPSDAVKFIADKQQAIDAYRLSKKNDPNYAEYQNFLVNAPKIASAIAQGRYLDLATETRVTNDARDVAVKLAAKDASFLTFYAKFFRYLFGPLERVSGN